MRAPSLDQPPAADVGILVMHFLYTAVCGLALLLGGAFAITLPDGYDTIWTTQSLNSAGSMPVGGGDLGLNVWVENGRLLFYMAQSGAFDENNSLLKLGRVNITMDPNPLDPSYTDSFKQHLHINEGYITVEGANNTLITLWVNMNTSSIHLSVNSDIEMKYTASVESWRTEGYQFYAPEQRGST